MLMDGNIGKFLTEQHSQIARVEESFYLNANTPSSRKCHRKKHASAYPEFSVLLRGTSSTISLHFLNFICENDGRFGKDDFILFSLITKLIAFDVSALRKHGLLLELISCIFHI